MSATWKTILAIVALMPLVVGNAHAVIHSVLLAATPSTELELTGHGTPIRYDPLDADYPSSGSE